MATIDAVLLFDILLVQGALLKTYLESQQGALLPSSGLCCSGSRWVVGSC